MAESGDIHVHEDLDVMAIKYARALSSSSGPEAHRRLRDEFVEAVLPFAQRLARRYRGRGELLEDLEQVARLGLVKAVDRYDRERGSFTAYALITITGELKKHFRDHTWSVHVPRRLQNLGLEVNRAEAELHKELKRLPTDSELATLLGAGEPEIRAARTSSAGYSSVSLSTPVGGEDGRALSDTIGLADRHLALVEDVSTVEGLLCRLPERERRMLALRFYGNLSQAEIAEAVGISQMHVSRLLSRALTWLRIAMISDAPPPWPGTDDADHRVHVFKRHVGAGELHVHVSGEIDRDNAGHLRRKVLSAVSAAGPRAVVLNLSEVPFLDAAGIAVLIAVHQAARVRALPIRVVGLRPLVARVVAASGIGDLLGDA
jgi:RNA polymerase sigma-B factor